GAMGAWIRGVGRSQREWSAVGVADGGGVPVGVRLPDGRDRAPELEAIFRLVHGDRAVREREIEESEEAGGLLQVRMVRDGGVLGDHVPGIPDRRGPEF